MFRRYHALISLFFFGLLFPTDLRAASTTADSLIADWSFNSPWGKVAFDESGNDHHGTLNDGAEFDTTAGRNDGAVQFDGQTGRVTVPAFDVVGDQISITASVFIESAGTTNNNDEGRIISKASSTAESGHVWMLGIADGSRLRFRLETDGRTRSYETPAGILATGRWTDVAAVYDGTEVRLYVDSTLIQSWAASGTIGTDPDLDVAIGNQPVGAGVRPLAGRIDRLRVYDRAVPFDEGGGAGGLVSHWRLDETSGNTAFDSAGNNDGTRQSGATFVPAGGYENGAAQFDGNAGRIDLPAIEINGSALSITAFIQIDDLSSKNRRDEGRIISKASGTAQSQHYWMLSLNETGRLRFRLKTTAMQVEVETGDNSLFTDQWTQVGAVYNGTTVRLYIDGMEVASAPANGRVAAGVGVGAAIGNQPAGAGDRPFAGRIDEVRLYDRAIEADELFGPGQAAALPVTWLDFGAEPVARGVTLAWAVADQRYNAGFHVERAAADAGVFTAIEFVPATEASGYTFTDRGAGSGSWLYRLRQEDYDGSSDYSKTILVRVQAEEALSVYPNPARGIVHSNRSGPYRLFAADGRELARGDYREGEPLRVDQLPAGVTYFLSIGGETTRFQRW
jgi:hypothetical protein